MFNFLNTPRYNNDVDWMSPGLKGWLINDGNEGGSPMKSQVSQYQGLGDMMSKGIDESNKFAGRIGQAMAKPGMPSMLSGLGQLVLAGGGVQNMPINSVANGVNKMANQMDFARMLNKGNLIPTEQNTPMQTMPKLNPVTDYIFGNSRLKSLDEFDTLMKLGFRR